MPPTIIRWWQLRLYYFMGIIILMSRFAYWNREAAAKFALFVFASVLFFTPVNSAVSPKLTRSPSIEPPISLMVADMYSLIAGGTRTISVVHCRFSCHTKGRNCFYHLWYGRRWRSSHKPCSRQRRVSWQTPNCLGNLP